MECLPAAQTQLRKTPLIAAEKRFWSRPLIAVMGTFTFVYLPHIVLMAVLPGYVVGLGGSKPTAGLVVSILSFTALFARPLFGRMLDTAGRRPVLILGSALFLAGTICQFFFSGLLPILVLRVVQGLGFSAVTTSSGVVIADLVEPKRLPEGLGWLQILFALCYAAGTASGIAIFDRIGYRPLYAMAIGLSAIGLCCAFATRYESDKPKTRAAAKPKAGVARGFEGAGNLIAAIAFVSFFVQASMGCVMAFMPLYSKHLGIGGTVAALFFPAYAAASITGVRTLGARVAERVGIDRVLPFCLLVNAASMLGLAFASSAEAFLLCGIFFGIGFGTNVPLLAAAMMKSSPPAKRGTANAANFAAMDIAMSVGPFGAGFIAQYAGYRPVYAAAALSVLCGLSVFLLAVRGRVPE